MQGESQRESQQGHVSESALLWKLRWAGGQGLVPVEANQTGYQSTTHTHTHTHTYKLTNTNTLSNKNVQDVVMTM